MKTITKNEAASVDETIKGLFADISLEDLDQTQNNVEKVTNQYHDSSLGAGGVRLVMKTYNSLEKDIF